MMVNRMKNQLTPPRIPAMSSRPSDQSNVSRANPSSLAADRYQPRTAILHKNAPHRYSMTIVTNPRYHSVTRLLANARFRRPCRLSPLLASRGVADDEANDLRK